MGPNTEPQSLTTEKVSDSIVKLNMQESTVGETLAPKSHNTKSRRCRHRIWGPGSTKSSSTEGWGARNTVIESLTDSAGSLSITSPGRRLRSDGW